MSTSVEQRAAAANDSYSNRSQIQVKENQRVFLSGEEYRIFGYANDPATGFHATAYQNKATNEVIIAYRGTDPGLFSGATKAEKAAHALTTGQDIAVDATMVRDVVNPQKGAADAFTAAMIDKAAKQGISKDHVFAAGHSLGGTLAEIEAAKYGLTGTTLNAFGAVGLIDQAPQPGCKLTNYVMAGDVVSAANPHVGDVVPLTSPDDIQSLHDGRYLSAAPGTSPPNPLLAMRLDDHSGKHFSGQDSVLAPGKFAQYEKNYTDNKAAIDHYRNDVQHERNELAAALRQDHFGYGQTRLPPDIQRNVDEYLAVNADAPVRKAAEQYIVHNAVVTGAEHRYQQGADAARTTGHTVQSLDERAAAGMRAAGDALRPLNPAAPLLGAVTGELAHLHGQAAHASSEYVAGQLEGAKHAVEQGAHNTALGAAAQIHNPAVQAQAVKGINAVMGAYDASARAGHTIEQVRQTVAQDIQQAEQGASRAFHATEQAAGNAFDTLTHPMQSLESAVASKISSEMSPAVDATRHQQRALHGEGSQVDRASEAQRQQEVQGHAAAHEAPLPPAPGVMSPGLRTAERDVSPPRHEPRPAARDQDAQTHTPTRHEPTTAPAAPDHAALAAQQAHQQAMHAQRQVQQERQPHDERAAPSPRAAASPETGRIAEAAALAPAVAPGIREAATVAPTVAASLRDAPQAPREPSQPDREASTQAPPEPQRHEPVAAPEHARAQPAVSNPAPAPTPFSERVASAQHDGPQASAQRAVPERANAAPVLSPPLDPPGLKDFRHPEHPLNERYEMFRDALGEQGFHQARPTLNDAPAVRGYSAEQKDRLAAGFTAQVGSDRQFNTEIQHFHKNGEILSAIEHPQRLGDRPLILDISEAKALAHTPEQHASTWRARELPEPQAVSTQRPDPQNLSPDHPGHPDHPRNALFENTRDALSTEYGRWGMQKGAEQLDRETVQVMTAARRGQMDDVGAVRLMPNREEGKIGAFPTMRVFETADAPGRVPSTVFVEGQTLQQAPSAQQAAPQFQVVDQQATQQIQQNQQLQAQINAQGPQGPGLGR